MLCATCDKKRTTISHCLRNYCEDQVVSHCRHLFSHNVTQIVCENKTIEWHRWQAQVLANGQPLEWAQWVNRNEPSPLLLFKLYRKLPSKTQTNCRKYNCNSTFPARGYLGGMGNSSGNVADR